MTLQSPMAFDSPLDLLKNYVSGLQSTDTLIPVFESARLQDINPMDVSWAIAVTLERRSNAREELMTEQDLLVVSMIWCWLRQVLPIRPKVAADLVEYMSVLTQRIVPGAFQIQSELTPNLRGRSILENLFSHQFLSLSNYQIVNLLAKPNIFVAQDDFPTTPTIPMFNLAYFPALFSRPPSEGRIIA